MENREIKFRAWDKKEKHFVYFELFSGVNNHTPPIYKDADLEYWQQYTGLKDKNSKEIYEGDILKKDDNIFLNEWNNKEARFDRIKISGSPEFDNVNTLEIIGNFYKNPELLNN